MSESNKIKVINVVQALLNDEDDKTLITPSLIEERIDQALMLSPKWKVDLDRDEVVKELIRRYSIWIGQDSALVNNEGHIPWLTPDRKANWRYWQRYRTWQESFLPWAAVEGLDKSTDEILELLEDPERKDPWDRRGLVVGHVQSGKTGNYTGLICKAADAGYKIIIVLAGLHNNLRSQTQMRLDEGFLGYETDPDPSRLRLIGVGEVDSDINIRPNYVTNRTEKGDFNTKAARTLGIRPEERPWLFVVKKNKTVLSRLHKWILDHMANTTEQETGRKIVTNLPLLVIDDEADNASVDTREQSFDFETDEANEEHNPTAINSLIRQILHAFSRKAYVGYTATPFANIFIHERGRTTKEGNDLFPEAFILNLAAPSNYIGPSRIFGLNTGEEREQMLKPLIHEIDDHNTDDGTSGWMPIKHKSSHQPYHPSEFGMPLSLVEAIDAFILACAVRNLRKQGHQHSSMLVHVTRFNAVQQTVHKQISTHISGMNQRLSRQIDHEEIMARLHWLWLEDFVPATREISEIVPDLVTPGLHDWSQVEQIIPRIVGEISVRMINGTAKDALDYADSATGLKVIAIGGDKLARGLTLEGLTTSYFLRASKMYDTLMQMGRWFGYRPGYLDLCRLYTTSELVEWFQHIADASLELREEFNLMVASGGTPRDFGLKVQSHPVLMVTSPLKMRTARSLQLSFSGSVVETVSFPTDEQVISANFKALKNLIAAMGEEHNLTIRERQSGEHKAGSSNRAYWENISHLDICDFLGSYRTHAESLKANSSLLKDFIEKMARIGELTQWSVAIIGGSLEEQPLIISDKTTIQRARRATNGTHSDRYAIRRLLSPRDESLDLDQGEWEAAIRETTRMRQVENQQESTDIKEPVGIACRLVRGAGSTGIKGYPERGLLLIYLPHDPDNLSLPADSDPFVGFGISFPVSQSGEKVEYMVNNVEWENNYDTFH
ncbi:endonuclease [Alkanindiges hydrocarboniclasticus]|uniref:Endonuclease n=2 Tax=Alkanindiges hydrocarboniclasticus TaxID=1907941 RepID=A0A1S8CWZ5_9GAMM|nr:endonuclease [Alkanindiges hydrocarboniclasticus]